MTTTSGTATLRLAVAGSGAMAHYHVRRFGSFPNVSVVGCYDRNPERAAAFTAACGLKHCAASLEELFEKAAPNALSVASADAEQHQIAVEAIERGIPTFLEKPATTGSKEAASLIEALKKRSVPVLVNFSKLNFPSVWGLVQLVRSGRLGRIESIELAYLQSWLGSTIWGRWWEEPRWLWRISSSRGGGGALRDLGSHILYLLLQLSGEPRLLSGAAEVTAERAAAEKSGYSCDLNDTFRARFELPRGGTARVHGSYASPGHTNYLHAKVVGEHGAAELHAEEDKNTLLVSPPKTTAIRPVRFAKVYSTYNAFLQMVHANSPIGSARDPIPSESGAAGGSVDPPSGASAGSGSGASGNPIGGSAAPAPGGFSGGSAAGSASSGSVSGGASGASAVDTSFRGPSSTTLYPSVEDALAVHRVIEEIEKSEAQDPSRPLRDG